MPSWSSDGREISFCSHKAGNLDIDVVPAAGGIPRQLTSEPSNEMWSSWSRDGRWIYFDSSRSGHREVWKAPARGGTAIQVTRNGGWYAQEAPNGRSIFFTKSVWEGGPPGLWRMPAEGGEETQVLANVLFDNFSVVERGNYYLNRNVEPSPAFEFHTPAGRVSRSPSKHRGTAALRRVLRLAGREVLPVYRVAQAQDRHRAGRELPVRAPHPDADGPSQHSEFSPSSSAGRSRGRTKCASIAAIL